MLAPDMAGHSRNCWRWNAVAGVDPLRCPASRVRVETGDAAVVGVGVQVVLVELD